MEWLQGLNLTGTAPRDKRAAQPQGAPPAPGGGTAGGVTAAAPPSLGGAAAGAGEVAGMAAEVGSNEPSPSSQSARAQAQQQQQHAASQDGGDAQAVAPAGAAAAPLLPAIQRASSSHLQASGSGMHAVGSADELPAPALLTCLIGQPDGYTSCDEFYFACVRPSFAGCGPLQAALELLDKHCKHEVGGGGG